MEEKKVKAKNGKLKRFLTYAGVVALILVAVIISLLFYRQKIETTNTVFKNLTEDWQISQDMFGWKDKVSFKYPKDWTANLTRDDYSSGGVIYYDIFNNKQQKTADNVVRLTLSQSRSINIKDPIYAIQISIPFDKQNYLIFSTSTNSNYKEIFYNIPVTLVIGK